MTRALKLTIVGLSSCLIAVLLVGTLIGRGEAADEAYRHFAVFSEVLSRIKSEYVEEPDMKNVALGAVNGLLEAIDPYASYLSPDQYRQYLKHQESPQDGVGLILSRRFGYVGIVDAIPGSPADKVGLSTGDVLETINSVATRDMPLAYAEMLLHGARGSTVELTVLRVGRGTEAQKFALVRGPLTLPPLSARTLPDGVAYLGITALDAGRVRQAAERLAQFEKEGARRLVLDLRHCASGSPEQGAALANLFLDKGLITYVLGQKTPRRDVQADPAKTAWRHPVAVITNRGTASGAEVAATALVENKRAEVVGERSYGDASIRRPVTMDDGSAVILSVAKYYGPAGKAIQDHGVTPSVPVVETDVTADAGDEPPAATPQPKPAEDVPLQKAVEVLLKGRAAIALTPGQPTVGAPAGVELTPSGVPRAPQR